MLDLYGDDLWSQPRPDDYSKTLWELKFGPRSRVFGTTDIHITPISLKALREKVLAQISKDAEQELLDSEDEAEDTEAPLLSSSFSSFTSLSSFVDSIFAHHDAAEFNDCDSCLMPFYFRNQIMMMSIFSRAMSRGHR